MTYVQTMHNYLSVMLVELVMMVLKADKEPFEVWLSTVITRMAAEVSVLALHCVAHHMTDMVMQDR